MKAASEAAAKARKREARRLRKKARLPKPANRRKKALKPRRTKRRKQRRRRAERLGGECGRKRGSGEGEAARSESSDAGGETKPTQHEVPQTKMPTKDKASAEEHITEDPAKPGFDRRMTEANQVRINELARELEVKAKAIIDLLPGYGVTEKKTHSSSIPEDVAEKVRKHLQGVADAEAAAEEQSQGRQGSERSSGEGRRCARGRAAPAARCCRRRRHLCGSDSRPVAAAAAAAPPAATPAAPPAGGDTCSARAGSCTCSRLRLHRLLRRRQPWLSLPLQQRPAAPAPQRPARLRLAAPSRPIRPAAPASTLAHHSGRTETSRYATTPRTPVSGATACRHDPHQPGRNLPPCVRAAAAPARRERDLLRRPLRVRRCRSGNRGPVPGTTPELAATASRVRALVSRCDRCLPAEAPEDKAEAFLRVPARWSGRTGRSIASI